MQSPSVRRADQMALEKRPITLSFSQGLDTKTDPKQVALGRLLELQNAVFVSPGRVRKRNGYTSLSRTVVTGGSVVIPTGNTLPVGIDYGRPLGTVTIQPFGTS